MYRFHLVDFFGRQIGNGQPEFGKIRAIIGQYSGCQATRFAQKPKQQVCRRDRVRSEALGLFRSISKNAFALVREWKVYGSRCLFTNGRQSRYFFSN